MKKILFIEFTEVSNDKHLLVIIKSLILQKKIISIVLCKKNSQLARELEKIGVKKLEVIFTELNLHHPETYILNLKLQFYIFKICFKYKISIIHSFRTNWVYLGILPSIILRIPLVVQVVVNRKLTSKFQNFLINLRKNKITFLAFSKNSAEITATLYNISPRQVFFFYSGLLFNEFGNKTEIPALKLIKNKGFKIISMISRLDPNKGVHHFIEMAAILHSIYSDLFFVHIGNHNKYLWGENYFEECSQLVKKFHLEDHFMFLNYLEKESELVYNSCFCTVLPTYGETLGYAILESSIKKVPVIFTKIGGTPEAFHSKKVDPTISFPPTSFQLYAQVKRLLTDQVFYKTVADQEYRYVQENFNATKNISQLTNIYQRILNNQ